MKPTDSHQSLHLEILTCPLILNTLSALLFLVKLYASIAVKDFYDNKLNMKEWFIKRSYPESIIDKEMKRVRFSEQGQKSKKLEKGVPFVATYHPLPSKLSSVIYSNLYLLYVNQKVKNVFTPGPAVSYRSARKISSYLVTAKLYPLERKSAFEKCGKSKCEVCLNIQETDAFTSTGENFKINRKLNCDDDCLIYLLTCKCCAKQYVGKTTDEFRFRWNKYKRNNRENARNEACTQKDLFEHIGCLGKASITLIDKTDGKIRES